MATILVVDDDNTILDLIQALMLHAGHQVMLAHDGKEALAGARQDKPDLIILDVMMPELDGISVSGILFQDPVLKLIPVIILTANSATRPILEMVPNVRLYMPKPFDPPDLIANVARFVGIPAKA